MKKRPIFNALRILFLRVALKAPMLLTKHLGWGVKALDGSSLTPQLRWFLRLMTFDTTNWESVDPAVERDAFERMATCSISGPLLEAHVEEHLVPGAYPVPVRLYRPNDAEGLLPGILWLHGGGWVLGGLNTHDRFCRRLALETQSVVIAADYRLAPEFPFPAPLEDVFGVWDWFRNQATNLGVDESRLALGGDSAGGNMTAVLCQSLPIEERPALQILCYPGTDFTQRHPTRLRYAEGYFLTEGSLQWFLNHYVPEARRADPRVSPLLAPAIADQPPALVITAGLDPLCDEGLLYADRLEEASTSVERIHEPAMIHGFVTLYGILPKGELLVAEMCRRIRTHFQRSVP